MLLLRFGHFVGLALWIGGAVATWVLQSAGRSISSEDEWPTFAALARIYGFVVAPGALLTILTGVLLTMTMTTRGMSQVLTRPGALVMQVAGLLAAVVVLFVNLPTANRLAAMLASEHIDPRAAAPLRRRQAALSTVAGLLALLALFCGIVVR